MLAVPTLSSYLSILQDQQKKKFFAHLSSTPQNSPPYLLAAYESDKLHMETTCCVSNHKIKENGGEAKLCSVDGNLVSKYLPVCVWIHFVTDTPVLLISE